MAKRKTRSRRKRAKRFVWIITGIMAAITSCMAVFMLILAKKEVNITKPDELLVTYMSYIQEKKYEEMYPPSEDDSRGAENIAEVYRDIYNEVAETNTLASPETKRCIVARLGENGYVAVDSENQVDMVGAEQALEFCKAVEEKKNGNLQNRSTVSYPANLVQYAEEGYLLFEGSYFSDENLGVGAVCRIPGEIFENVVMAYMDIDKETLQQKTTYLSEEAAYEYGPWGLYEAEYPDIPY